MNLVQSLTAVSGYPIPRPLVLSALEGEELDPLDEATKDMCNSKAYKRCLRSVYQFLVTAPNVTQNGISYSLTDKDKAQFSRIANGLASEIGESSYGQVEYGYQGDSF